MARTDVSSASAGAGAGGGGGGGGSTAGGGSCSSSLAFQLLDVRFSDGVHPSSSHPAGDASLLDEETLADEEEASRARRRPAGAGGGVAASGGADDGEPRRLVVYLFGRAADGRSVCVLVHGYAPELYYSFPSSSSSASSSSASASSVSSSSSSSRSHSGVGGSSAASAAVREVKSALLRLLPHGAGSHVEAAACERLNVSDVRLDASGGRVRTPYVRVRFATLWAYSKACYADASTAPAAVRRPHHTKPSLEAKFLVEHGLVPSRWVRVLRWERPTEFVSHCAIEVVVRDGRASLRLADELEANAPLRALAFDIEAVSMDRTFPDATKPDDATCQISLVAWTVGEEGAAARETRHLISLGETSPIDGCAVHSCAHEAQVYTKFRELLIREDPDFVLQYNGFAFDVPYLHARANETLGEGACDAFNYSSRFRFVPCKLRTKTLSSKGMGSNSLRYVDMPGRSNFDVFLWYKSNFKEASYGLNDVAMRVLGERKDDFAYDQILPHYLGTPEMRATMGRYCVQDSVLLRRLASRLTFLEGDLAQSAVSMVIVQRLQTHGQGIKVISQMARCAAMPPPPSPGGSSASVSSGPSGAQGGGTPSFVPFVLDNDALDASAAGNNNSGQQKYEGATVLEPITGYYDRLPVIVLDFASLYPSVMISHNLCKSTSIRSPADFGKPGVVAIDVGGGRRNRFTTTNPGILPTMLRELLDMRKSIKRRMAQLERSIEEAEAENGDEAGDDDERRRQQRDEWRKRLLVLNKRQLAVKISANSVYGFMGAEAYPCREAAETTTAVGRRMLEETSAFVAREARSLRRESDGEPVGELTMVYGDTDSVMFTLSNVRSPADGACAGEALARAVTSMFHARGETAKKLEWEKCYFPWMLFSKKRYGGILWNRRQDGVVVARGEHHSGTPNKRRDSCAFVQRMYAEMLGALLANDRSRCVRTFEARMEELISGRVPIGELVMSKAVGDEYKTVGLCWRAWSGGGCEGDRALPPASHASSSSGGGGRRVVEIEPLLARRSRELLRSAGRGAPTTIELDRNEVLAAKRALEFEVTTSSYAIVDGQTFVPDEESLAHMRVVEKQRERQPGSETRAGNRVQFVFVERTTGVGAGGARPAEAGTSGAVGATTSAVSSLKARDVVEDAEYAASERLPLHIGYYIEHQVKGPILPLLELVHGSSSTLLQAYVEEHAQRRRGVRRLVSGSSAAAVADAVSRETLLRSERRKRTAAVASLKRPRPSPPSSSSGSGGGGGGGAGCGGSTSSALGRWMLIRAPTGSD